MKNSRNKRTIIILAFIFLSTFGLYFTDKYIRENKPPEIIQGRITNISRSDDQPTDAPYSIELYDETGNIHSVSVRQIKTTASTTASTSEACVKIPDIKAGDTITFYLPKQSNSGNTFVTCHDKSETGYFFRKK